MKKKINFYSRRGKYGYLSNFWRQEQRVDGTIYQTNEHFYQATKSENYGIRHWITNAPNPYLAMKAGRSLREGRELTSDWDSRKVKVMLIGLRSKFRDPVLREKLLETGDAILHEDSPTDMFWGKKGEDMLGKLLMQVRDEIRQEE